MKIEMGESLIYSWLRHVKECQIVQTNWKSSQKWIFNHNGEIETMLNELDEYFSDQYGYKVFKKNVSLSQIILQGECDVLGLNVAFDENGENPKNNYYAVDIAYHQQGLNYGSKTETVLKIIAKCIRTIFSLYGFLGAREGEIIFASPKVGKRIYEMANPLIEMLNAYFKSKGFNFNIRFIYNESFNEKIIKPVALACNSIADTSELFVRAYQLIEMFSDITEKTVVKGKKTMKVAPAPITVAYDEMKIGQIARTVLRDLIESKDIKDPVITKLQDPVYSKDVLGVKYPVLVAEGSAFDPNRYYAAPIEIKGKKFYLTNDWYEKNRDKLIDWIEKNK